MKVCPCCFEELPPESLAHKPLKCPSCSQFLIDPPIERDFHSVDTKRCLFCGKDILKEAKICRYCRRWLDEVDQAVDELEDREENE